MESPYNLVAGLDIHKNSVVVIVLQSAQPEEDYASGTFGTTQFGLTELAAFLRQHGVTQVAMESTAFYRCPPRPQVGQLRWRRIAKRLLSGDLTVSYVPRQNNAIGGC